jgi:CRISPR system Cascade subunit CasE
MFLTRFPINKTRRESGRLLGSPYRMHAAVAGSFPGTNRASAGDSRPLWRVDLEPSGAAYLYIVSSTAPSLVGIDEQIGFPDLQPQWETRDYDPMLDRLAFGQVWAFRLTANPVMAVKRSQEAEARQHERGQRVGHVTATQQAAWLIGVAAYGMTPKADIPPNVKDEAHCRAATNGFEVVKDDSRGGVPRLIIADRHRWAPSHGQTGGTITFDTARFDGVLRVTDVDRLRHALTHGIGHQKAFGCGLLTLAPVALSTSS